jgi:rhodanese-related sulfurtransferase
MGQDKISLSLAFSQSSAQKPSQITPKYQIIGLVDAIQFYYRTNVIFLDARETNYFSNGHITGARNVIPSQIRSDASLLSILKRFNYCVVYCNNSSCGVATESALLLNQLGVTNLLVYSGGWEEWEACHLPATIQSDNRL